MLDVLERQAGFVRIDEDCLRGQVDSVIIEVVKGKCRNGRTRFSLNVYDYNDRMMREPYENLGHGWRFCSEDKVVKHVASITKAILSI